MIEKIKTIILVILVISSLLLTGFLIFPDFTNSTVSLSEYLPRIKFGDDAEMQQMIKPVQIISHFGKNKHTVSFPNMNYYKKIEAEMNHWSFYDFYAVYYGIDWQEMVENRQGIEIVFPDALSYSLLSSVFKLSTTTAEIDAINRLWLTVDHEDNLLAYFISEEKDRVIAAQTSISSQKLKEYLSYGMNKVEFTYHWAAINQQNFVKSIYYLPKESFEMEIYRSTYAPVSVQDFIQLLFIDPMLVRKVYEMNGNQNVIYTDGTRSMQYYPNERYIKYYQPVSNDETQLDIKKDLYAAVRFVNQHGGWDGTYFIKSIEESKGPDQAVFTFRQFIDGYPVLEHENHYGTIQMYVQDGIVSQFQRSMLLLDKYVEVRSIQVSGEEEIFNLLEQKQIAVSNLQTVTLGYKIIKTQDLLDFIPYWEIRLQDNQVIAFPAYERVVHNFGLE